MLEMSMVAFRIGHVSITGNYRENNEDSCVVDARQRYAIVADGMGGQSAGSAQVLAIELIPRSLDKLLDFQNANPTAVNECWRNPSRTPIQRL